jgi:hypothetical protein
MEDFQKRFIPGIELNRHFYQQVIKPLLEENYPKLKYAAGILGEGSDVLGFDNPQSIDHNWGPHMRIFLDEKDFKLCDEISEMFRKRLPVEFMGYPTNFTKANEKIYLVQQMKHIKKGPVNHLIQFYTIKSFFNHYLGFDPNSKITYADWLTFPQQALLEITRGEVYHDEIGLNKAREKFKYYPDEVWLYIYAHQWGYIGDEEAYMGRSGEIGDELGSNLIASRIANNIVKLCFLFEKHYIPYSKWLGTAFSRLEIANDLTYPLYSMITAKDWREREEYMGKAYSIIATKHNELKITKKMPIDAAPSDRPHKIIGARKFYDEIAKKFHPYFKNLKFQIGSIDQFVAHARVNHMNYVHRDLVSIFR